MHFIYFYFLKGVFYFVACHFIIYFLLNIKIIISSSFRSVVILREDLIVVLYYSYCVNQYLVAVLCVFSGY